MILRPGIVYGPRSQWIAGFARAVVEGSASVVADGRGVCNAIYVDNLVHAVDLALEREEAAAKRSSSPTTTPSPGGCSTSRSAGRWALLGRGRRPPAPLVATDAGRAPARAQGGSGRARRPRPGSEGGAQARFDAWPSFRLPSLAGPRRPTLETSILQTCGYRFPTTKARRMLGFEPPVAFDEACRRTVAWLGFAGYPLAAATGAA